MSDPALSIDPVEPDPTGQLLSEPQRRHLEVVLGMLERLMDLIDGMGQCPRRRSTSVLAVDVADVPAETFAALEPYLEAARAQVRHLTTSLSLRPQPRSTRQRLHALLIGEMVRLDDRADRMLRGFGEMHSAVPSLLDPSLGAIREALAAMQRLVDAAPNVAPHGEAPVR